MILFSPTEKIHQRVAHSTSGTKLCLPSTKNVRSCLGYSINPFSASETLSHESSPSSMGRCSRCRHNFFPRFPFRDKTNHYTLRVDAGPRTKIRLCETVSCRVELKTLRVPSAVIGRNHFPPLLPLSCFRVTEATSVASSSKNPTNHWRLRSTHSFPQLFVPYQRRC